MLIFSALSTLSVNAYGHVHHSPDATSFLTTSEDAIVVVDLNISSHFLIIQSFLNAVGYMLL